MKTYLSRLTQHSRVKVLVIFYGVILITTYVFSEFIQLIDSETYIEATIGVSKWIDSYSLVSSLFVVVILLPLFETIVFQFFALKLLIKLTARVFHSIDWRLPLVCSALIFSAYHGLGHESAYHGVIVAIPTLPGAFVFSLLAILEFERERGHPIASVFFLHAFYNLVVLTQHIVFE